MNAELSLGVSLGLCLGGILFWVATRRESRRRRRWSQQRHAVLEAIRSRFGLSEGEPGRGGEAARRPVSVRLNGEYLIEASFVLRASVLPPSVRLVEFADGPYQKQEERCIGGAHEVGDADFDAKFLAYGERGEVRRVDAKTRALLLRHWMEGVTVCSEAVSLWVPSDPDQAMVAVDRVLALCDALDATADIR